MKSFFTPTNFSFESVEVLLCALEIYEFQVLKSGNTDGVSRKIPFLQFLLLNNSSFEELAILNTEINFALLILAISHEFWLFPKSAPLVTS